MKKIYYCKECMCKLGEDDKCDGCLMRYPTEEVNKYPFFCGNCNTHVGVLSEKDGKKIIKVYKDSKMDFPEDWAVFSWKD